MKNDKSKYKEDLFAPTPFNKKFMRSHVFSLKKTDLTEYGQLTSGQSAPLRKYEAAKELFSL